MDADAEILFIGLADMPRLALGAVPHLYHGRHILASEHSANVPSSGLPWYIGAPFQKVQSTLVVEVSLTYWYIK